MKTSALKPDLNDIRIPNDSVAPGSLTENRQGYWMGLGQGLFYLVSGLWPLADIHSFEKVTGPKKDDWLVKTVGLLIATTGATLLYSSIRKKRVEKELAALAASQAIVLGGVSLFYSSIGRISKIYLLDSAVEFSIAGAWIVSQRRSENETEVHAA